MSVRLIVNADDFGFTRDVNAGIVAAHREGILTATTLMANAPAFDDAVRLAKENPTLDIGCHLVLVQGEGLPASIPALLLALAARRIDVYAELRRQVRKIVDAGIHLTHLDTHKHTHLAPLVLDAVIRISHEFHIPWVRTPVDFHMRTITAPKRLTNQAVRLLGNRAAAKLRAAGCRTTDHFAGFQITGHLDAAALHATIRELPDGLTELMCHPGFLTAELQNATTRLKESRVIEYQALTSLAVREAVKERGVRLVCYRDL